MDIRQNLKDGKYTNNLPWVPNTLRTAYRAEEQRIVAQLKADLFESWNVSGKKAEMVWDRAWDDGHADGYYSVIDHFEDLVELILP